MFFNIFRFCITQHCEVIRKKKFWHSTCLPRLKTSAPLCGRYLESWIYFTWDALGLIDLKVISMNVVTTSWGSSCFMVMVTVLTPFWTSFIDLILGGSLKSSTTVDPYIKRSRWKGFDWSLSGCWSWTIAHMFSESLLWFKKLIRVIRSLASWPSTL